MKIKIIILGVASFVLVSCSDTSTNSTTTTSTIETTTTSEENNSTIPPSNTSTSATPNAENKKTDAELILDGAELAVNAISDLAEIARVKDSIRQADKDRMFAFQVGMKMKEKDAYVMYNKLTNEGIPSVYVFKVGRKDYYVVQFEAKGEEELSLSKGDFKTSLGDLGTEGIKIINLNEEFCPKRKSVKRETIEHDGDEIKCLFCD